MLFIRRRSVLMPSDAEESGASGCGRRVSLNRRTSVACVASRKMSAGIQPLHAAQLPVRLRELREKILFADVHDDRHARDAFAPHELGQRRNERRRNVVDAEVAEIFERPNRLRFTRARKARQHDEPRLAGRRSTRPRGRRAASSTALLRRQADLRSPTRPCSSRPASCSWCSSLSASFFAAWCPRARSS